MGGLYDVIGDLRREYSTLSASRTLDLVTAELGRTQDNLSDALTRIDQRALSAGGRLVLQELKARATAKGVANLRVPLSHEEEKQEKMRVKASSKPSPGELGIAVALGGSTLLGLVLTAAAIASVFIHG
jgi:hypothetical protein